MKLSEKKGNIMAKLLLISFLVLFMTGCDTTESPDKYSEDGIGTFDYFTEAPRDTSFAYDVEHYGIEEISAEDSLLVSMAPALKKADTRDENSDDSDDSSGDDDSDSDRDFDDSSGDDDSDSDRDFDDSSGDDDSDSDRDSDDSSGDDDSDSDDSEDDSEDDDSEDDNDEDDSSNEDEDDSDSSSSSSSSDTTVVEERIYLPTTDFQELGTMSVTLNNKTYSFKVAEDHVGSQVFAPKFTRLGDGSYKVDIIGYSYTEDETGDIEIRFADGIFTMEFIVPSLDTNGDFIISRNILTNAAENDVEATVVIRPADGLNRVHLTVEVRDFTLYNKDKSLKLQAHFGVDVTTSIN